MDKTEIKEMIGWMEQKGHTDEEILDCIRRMVGAPARKGDQKSDDGKAKKEK